MQQGAVPGDKDSAKMDDVLDAAKLQGVKLNPNAKKEMEKNVEDQMKDDSVKETIFDLPVIDEDDLEERKRRYSFSRAEFGKGIVTDPATKRHRSAKRGLTLLKK